MPDETGRQRAIRLLSDDLRDEHGAIVQYLRHAWAATDDALRARLEGIARDEMWHFQWLSQKISDLGGKPSVERSPVAASGTLLELMDTNIQAEEKAIAQYRKHQNDIADDETKVLLERIISDETRHREAFEDLKNWLAKEGGVLGALRVDDVERPLREDETLLHSGTPEADVLNRLQKGIEHEYTVILKYLMQAYRLDDPEASRQIWESAIDEMKHLGWLAEGMVERGGVPNVEHSSIGGVDSVKKSLQENLRDEEKIIAQYKDSFESVDDPDLKEIFGRLKLDEDHHRHILLRLLKRVSMADPSRLTVGSLMSVKGGSLNHE